MKCFALVDFQLAVVCEANRIALPWARGGPFKVDAVFVKSATMAGTFKLLLGFQPVGRAAQVRADRFQGIDLLLPLKLAVDDPDTELSHKFCFDFARRESFFGPHLKSTWGFSQHVWKHKTGESQRE